MYVFLQPDTYAVCATCNRLSTDLRVCDSCGTTLSDDSAAHCYSAEPKRPCLDTRASDTTSTQCNGISLNTNGTTVSTVSLSASDSAVRPQALYVNVNNQAFPVISVQATSAQSASRPSVSASTHVNSSVSNPSTSNVFTTSQVSSVATTRSLLLSTQSSSQPRPANISSVTATQITLPTYNLQPPIPSFISNVTRLPVHGLASSTANTPVQAATTVAPVTSSSYVFQVTAIQIRLGTKKFKPLTAVTFKDDGVLFTLTGLLV